MEEYLEHGAVSPETITKMIYKRAEDISSQLKLDNKQIKEMNDLLDQYPMLIPEYYYSLIDFNDPDDPIRKMSIPSTYEFDREKVREVISHDKKSGGDKISVVKCDEIGSFYFEELTAFLVTNQYLLSLQMDLASSILPTPIPFHTPNQVWSIFQLLLGSIKMVTLWVMYK